MISLLFLLVYYLFLNEELMVTIKTTGAESIENEYRPKTANETNTHLDTPSNSNTKKPKCAYSASNNSECNAAELSYGSSIELESELLQLSHLPPQRWPNNIVFYRLSKNYGETMRTRITKAMEEIQNETCIRFEDVARTTLDYRHFIDISDDFDSSCLTEGLGYSVPLSGAPQRVSLPSKCGYGLVQHELLHVLGVHHQHVRPDRDQFINVYMDNVEPGEESYFEKKTATRFETYNLPYDYSSVMHYRNNAHAKNFWSTTMEAKINSSLCLGQDLGVTECDLELVRLMYGCYIRKRKCRDNKDVSLNYPLLLAYECGFFVPCCKQLWEN